MITPEVLRMWIPLDVSRWVFLFYGIPYTRNPTVGAMLQIGLYNVFHTIIGTHMQVIRSQVVWLPVQEWRIPSAFGARFGDQMQSETIAYIHLRKLGPETKRMFWKKKSYGEAKKFQNPIGILAVQVGWTPGRSIPPGKENANAHDALPRYSLRRQISEYNLGKLGPPLN